MKLFLGLESSGAAGSKWQIMANMLEPIFNAHFEDKEYPFLESIGIISVIMQDEYIDGYPERVYFSRKKKFFDVRLHIPYKAFCYSKGIERRRLYADHIIASLKAFESRMKTKEEKAALCEIIGIADEILQTWLGIKDEHDDTVSLLPLAKPIGKM